MGQRLAFWTMTARLLIRLGGVLASCDCWRLDAVGLIQIEDIRPPDKRNAGWPAALARDRVPGFVMLFEDLVVDDGSGPLTLLDAAAELEGLSETDPERGL